MHEWAELALNIYKCNHQILDVLVVYFSNFSTEKPPHSWIYSLTFEKAETQLFSRGPIQPIHVFHGHLHRGLLHPMYVFWVIIEVPDWVTTDLWEQY